MLVFPTHPPCDWWHPGLLFSLLSLLFFPVASLLDVGAALLGFCTCAVPELRLRHLCSPIAVRCAGVREEKLKIVVHQDMQDCGQAQLSYLMHA